MARARQLVPDLDIVHLPAVNEELAATAVMGSQLAASRPDRRVEGVVGVWYGKAPGLDRAGDALRHATFAGTSPRGGAIALVGDDPACKSSTMPSSSDASLVDLHMPILYPGTVGECLELGLHGIALSRVTGLWSSLKIVTPVADATESVTLPVFEADPQVPVIEVDGKPWQPHPSAQLLGPRMLEVEREFHDIRLTLAHDYGVLNNLNQVIVDPPDAWIGLIATGYTYQELRQALRRLGLADDAAVADAGIRLLRLRLPVPFNERQLIHFARGLDEIVVVEEKNPTLERLVRDALYPTPLRPWVTGKRGPAGEQVFPSHGLLNADAMLPGLRARLATRLAERLAPDPPPARPRIALTLERTPFFCSGCPHNWGTKVPPGSVVGMGTGCHGMTLLMDEERVGQSIGITAMGNEGAQWLGMAPFVRTPHVFQNLGDGTYFHSGQLSVQMAVAAGANMTFKLFVNDTVAMTGGQDAVNAIGVPELTAVLLAQGVAKVAITTDDPARYRGVPLPEGVRVFDRTRILAVQEELAATPGVTVLIHHQACATELRRARKRGRLPTPSSRVVINHRICEGCGDCGDKSNCLSVVPVETPLGRKTRIDQETCNVDLSCLEGDCPAFMTVQLPPGDQGAARVDPATLPVAAPAPPTRTQVAIRLAGIGGTGVVSAAQIIGVAAMLEGFEVDGLDQTGLSQKAGPVVSDLTLTRPGRLAGEGPHERSVSWRAKLVGTAQADLLLAFDQLVAASPAALAASSPERTVTIASTADPPVGIRIAHPEVPQQGAAELGARLRAASVPGGYLAVDATAAVEALTGVPATANVFLIGVALQRGLLPVAPERLRQAIELNGVAVQANLDAFEWGRRWAADPARVDELVARRTPATTSVRTGPLPGRLARRVAAISPDAQTADLLTMLTSDLVAYQDRFYAGRFLDLVERAAAADARAGGQGALTRAVARGYHKLLAYKDEYEVARLMLSEDGLAAARAVGGDQARITWHLHPPILRAAGWKKKVRFGPRSRPVFQALAAMKRLRGTPIDPFGRTEVRRLERRLPVEYATALEQVLARVEPASLPAALEIAALPEQVRGYEELKLRRAAEYRRELAARVASFGTRGAREPSSPMG